MIAVVNFKVNGNWNEDKEKNRVKPFEFSIDARYKWEMTDMEWTDLNDKIHIQDNFNVNRKLSSILIPFPKR